MNIELLIDPVTMRKIEVSAKLAGKSVDDFLADFFYSVGRPTHKRGVFSSVKR